jgi:TetR/AcrR family transcriptional regulator, cholesterol catabolism regulator
MVETRRRRQIEDVASELFRERGYEGTSVRDIARALDIRGASLYAHVTSKEDVLWAIVDRAACAFETTAAFADERTHDQPASVRLRAHVEAHLGVVTADPEAASVFDREWRHLRGGRRAAMLERRDAYERRLRELIQDGTGHGEFVEVDPSLAAAFLLTSLNAVASWYRPDGALSAAAITHAYADMAVRSLTEAGR